MGVVEFRLSGASRRRARFVAAKVGFGSLSCENSQKALRMEFQTGCRADATCSPRLAISIPKSNENLHPHCHQKTRCRLCRAEIVPRQLRTHSYGVAAAISGEFSATRPRLDWSGSSLHQPLRHYSRKIELDRHFTCGDQLEAMATRLLPIRMRFAAFLQGR